MSSRPHLTVQLRPEGASQGQACLTGRAGRKHRKSSLKSAAVRMGCTSPSASATAGLSGVLRTKFLVADWQHRSLPMALPTVSGRQQW